MEEKLIFEIVKRKKALEKIRELKKVDVREVNDSGQTLLHLAVLQNNIALAAELLEKGYSPNAKDCNQLSPLIASAANGFSDMFQLLLTYQPDLTQVNRFGGTALLPSSEKGFIEVVQKALDAGVPVNHQNKLGWTALLEAVILGDEGFLYRDIIEELLEYGADTMIQDFNEKTVTDYARESDNQLILSLLEDRMKMNAFSKIKKLIRDGNYFESIKELLHMDTSVEQIYYLGVTYEYMKDYDSALYYYGEGYQLENQFAYYLANIAKKMSKTELALAYFEKGEEKKNDKSFFSYHKSNYLRELGRHELAISVMNELIESSPKRVDYLFHKANSLRSLSRYQEAYKTMLVASEMQPNNDLFIEQANEILLSVNKDKGVKR